MVVLRWALHAKTKSLKCNLKTHVLPFEKNFLYKAINMFIPLVIGHFDIGLKIQRAIKEIAVCGSSMLASFLANVK